jgi:electron transfer flavoprotein alpha subunit
MILVIAEQRDGKVNRATWEPVAAGQQAGGPLKIVVVGSATDGPAGELATANVDEVVIVDDPALKDYTADGYVMALAAVIEQERASLVFLPHTYQTRDFAPALAVKLDRAVVTDVTAFRKDGDAFVYTRPVFQGKLAADVALTGPTPTS